MRLNGMAINSGNSKVRSGIPMATVGPKPREGSPGRGVPRATKPLEENNKFHKVR
jgi:hypothetical protein